MRRRVLFVLIAPLALGACSASTGPGGGGIELWVANYQGSLLGYTAAQLASSTSAAPAVVIARSDTNPSIAFDSRGNLWVSNPVHNMVAEYTADQLTVSGPQLPSITLTANAARSLNGPVGLTFDAGGNLWIANAAGTVVEFTKTQLAASGDPTPVVTLAGVFSSIVAPAALTFDQDGNLWVTGIFSDAVIKFAANQLRTSGSPAPVVVLSVPNPSAIASVVALAFDSAGNMWVAAQNSGQFVEFDKSQLAVTGAPTPAVTLMTDAAPLSLAFDGHGNLWAANSFTNTVVEFAASQLLTSGSPVPAVTINGTSLSQPIAVAFGR